MVDRDLVHRAEITIDFYIISEQLEASYEYSKSLAGLSLLILTCCLECPKIRQ